MIIKNQANPVEMELKKTMTKDERQNARKNSELATQPQNELQSEPQREPMTMEDLPAPGTHRWITRRKAEVVAGVRSGLISLEDACRRYSLSVEEFLSWQTTLDRHGISGLRVTRLQDLRPNGGWRPSRG